MKWHDIFSLLFLLKQVGFDLRTFLHNSVTRESIFWILCVVRLGVASSPVAGIEFSLLMLHAWQELELACVVEPEIEGFCTGLSLCLKLFGLLLPGVVLIQRYSSLAFIFPVTYMRF